VNAESGVMAGVESMPVISTIRVVVRPGFILIQHFGRRHYAGDERGSITFFLFRRSGACPRASWHWLVPRSRATALV